MVKFETNVTIDQGTLKKIKKHLITPYSKKKFLLEVIIYGTPLILSLIFGSTSLFFVSFYFMLFSFLNRFVGIPYGKVEAFLKRIKKARNKTDETAEYLLLTLFNIDSIVVKNITYNSESVIEKISYERVRYLIETEEYYFILPKNKVGWQEWDNNFIIVDKVNIIEEGKRERFIDLLKERCGKLKIIAC